MKQLCLASILAACSCSAAAAWVEVGGNDQLIAYADPDTIRRSGNRVEMSVLYDFRKTKTSPSGKSFLSVKERDEFDCNDQRSRVLNFSWYSGQMSAGNVVLSNSVTRDWQPIPVGGSVIEPLWKFACGKK